MAAGEFHVYYRLISNSDCGWGSFVCHWPVSRSNVPQNLLLRRPFKGGNANKEQRWQVSQTKSHGYLSTSATHIWWNTLNLQIMYPLFQWQQVKKNHTDLFTFSTLHFTRLLKDGVTEIAAAQTVVTLNVDLALFLMEGTCGQLTLPLEQNGNWLSFDLLSALLCVSVHVCVLERLLAYRPSNASWRMRRK